MYFCFVHGTFFLFDMLDKCDKTTLFKMKRKQDALVAKVRTKINAHTKKATFKQVDRMFDGHKRRDLTVSEGSDAINLIQMIIIGN